MRAGPIRYRLNSGAATDTVLIALEGGQGWGTRKGGARRAEENTKLATARENGRVRRRERQCAAHARRKRGVQERQEPRVGSADDAGAISVELTWKSTYRCVAANHHKAVKAGRPTPNTNRQQANQHQQPQP